MDISPECRWSYDNRDVDWDALVDLYWTADFGWKSPDKLKTVFSNSMFKCFVYSGPLLVGAGRALADGADCAYIADLAVHPAWQGHELGREILES